MICLCACHNLLAQITRATGYHLSPSNLTAVAYVCVQSELCTSVTVHVPYQVKYCKNSLELYLDYLRHVTDDSTAAGGDKMGAERQPISDGFGHS